MSKEIHNIRSPELTPWPSPSKDELVVPGNEAILSPAEVKSVIGEAAMTLWKYTTKSLLYPGWEHIKTDGIRLKTSDIHEDTGGWFEKSVLVAHTRHDNIHDVDVDAEFRTGSIARHRTTTSTAQLKEMRKLGLRRLTEGKNEFGIGYDFGGRRKQTEELYGFAVAHFVEDDFEERNIPLWRIDVRTDDITAKGEDFLPNVTDVYVYPGVSERYLQSKEYWNLVKCLGLEATARYLQIFGKRPTSAIGLREHRRDTFNWLLQTVEPERPYLHLSFREDELSISSGLAYPRGRHETGVSSSRLLTDVGELNKTPNIVPFTNTRYGMQPYARPSFLRLNTKTNNFEFDTATADEWLQELKNPTNFEKHSYSGHEYLDLLRLVIRMMTSHLPEVERK